MCAGVRLDVCSCVCARARVHVCERACMVTSLERVCAFLRCVAWSASF